MAMPEVSVDRAVLHAFAQLHYGERFQPLEVRCRLVQAETDEGYPIEGHVVEVYAVPEDPEWHAHMTKTYGAGPHDIVFFRDTFEAGDRLTERVTEYLRRRVFEELDKARDVYERAVALVEGLINEE